MKIFTITTLAALTLLATPLARAWTYNDGDLLLVFRGSAGGSIEDVEFDIGSVTNYLGRTNGYTTTVTGWDPSLVTGTFGSFNNVDIVLAATVDVTNWVTGVEPNTTAYNVGSSGADNIWSAINGTGNGPLYPSAIPTSGANSYVIDTQGLYKRASYDYIVGKNGHSYLPKLGGNVNFVVEGGIPSSLDFWQINSTANTPQPPDKLIGTFSITAGGVLTFVAGPRASTVSKVSRSGNVSTVQFTTTVGNIYSIAYTNKLGGASAWPVDANPLVGDGSIDTLSHTNATAAEFYRIQTK